MYFLFSYILIFQLYIDLVRYSLLVNTCMFFYQPDAFSKLAKKTLENNLWVMAKKMVYKACVKILIQSYSFKVHG